VKGISIVKLFKSLSCRRRLDILNELKKGDLCICELKPKFKIDISTISRHVKELESMGLIRVNKIGTKKYLSLTTPKILDLIDSAKELIDLVETKKEE
jgi:ArsR family transcriptional regulator